VFDFPLESSHPQAFKASEATHCAREQGKYWEMHDRLFANQRQLTPWSTHAEALGLDVAAFEACLDSDKYAKNIRQDMDEARKAGTTGTPSFILARTDPTDPTRVTGLSFIRGAQPFTAFKAQIDQALASGKDAK
jgi:predicted DsbA family dithiol-disulfide isomerase